MQTISHETAKRALSGRYAASSYHQLLNGTWQFHCLHHPGAYAFNIRLRPFTQDVEDPAQLARTPSPPR